MSIEGMFKSSKQKTSQSSETDPWDETIPYLKDFLGKLGGQMGQGTIGATDTQNAAADRLRKLGMDGNPNSGDIQKLADDLFATKSRAGDVGAGYADLERRLSGTADGSNLDILNNPHLAKLMTRVGDDAAQRVNSQFAAAGRDLSGYNQRALGEGVTGAQLPLLLNQYNTEQGRSDSAARDLFAAKTGTATTQDMLDRAAFDTRSKGIDAQKARMDLDAWGPQMVMQLEQQLKGLPYEDLSKIAELLFPAAGLGGQAKGTSRTQGTTVGFGGKLPIYG